MFSFFVFVMSLNFTENATTTLASPDNAFHSPPTNTLVIAIVSILICIVCAYACAYVCLHTCCRKKK